MRLRFPNKFIRPKKLKFNFNGQHLSGLEGDTVFSALSAANILGFREDRKGNKRGAFCGMGACQDCLVSINGGVPERACMAKLKDDGLQDHIRWSVLKSFEILTKHSTQYQRLVEAFKETRPLEECVAIIE